MAKKGLLVLALAALVAGGAFAQIQMSAGGGFLFDGGRIGGVKTDDPKTFTGSNALGFGGFLFFDATYAELSVGFMGGPVNNVLIVDGERQDTGDSKTTFTAMDISLLGKYPIALGESFSIFPMLGFSYRPILGMKFDGEKLDGASDASTFRIQLGVGGDIGITESLYFRPQVLGYYGFAPKDARDSAKLMNDAFDTDAFKAAGGFGAVVKLGVGYKF